MPGKHASSRQLALLPASHLSLGFPHDPPPLLQHTSPVILEASTPGGQLQYLQRLLCSGGGVVWVALQHLQLCLGQQVQAQVGPDGGVGLGEGGVRRQRKNTCSGGCVSFVVCFLPSNPIFIQVCELRGVFSPLQSILH